MNGKRARFLRKCASEIAEEGIGNIFLDKENAMPLRNGVTVYHNRNHRRVYKELKKDELGTFIRYQYPDKIPTLVKSVKKLIAQQTFNKLMNQKGVDL